MLEKHHLPFMEIPLLMNGDVESWQKAGTWEIYIRAAPGLYSMSHKYK